MPEKPAKQQAAEARLKLAQDRQRRRAMGRPLAIDEAGLDEAAAVRQTDTQRALAWWRSVAPPRFKNLLDAAPDED